MGADLTLPCLGVVVNVAEIARFSNKMRYKPVLRHKPFACNFIPLCIKCSEIFIFCIELCWLKHKKIHLYKLMSAAFDSRRLIKLLLA